MLLSIHHCLVCLFDNFNAQRRAWYCFKIHYKPRKVYICLQKMFALFGKGSTGSCKKLHVLFKEKLAPAYHSWTYISYINAALRSSVNSSAYGWLSYWVFILSTSCPLLFIWSNSQLFPSCLLSKSVWGGHFFNL